MFAEYQSHLLHVLVVLVFGCCHSGQVIGLCCCLIGEIKQLNMTAAILLLP